MSAPLAQKYLTIPRLDRIPWLIHGFGTRTWTLDDFQGRPEWRAFKIYWLDQVHSDEILFLDVLPHRRPSGDALATRLPGIFLVIKTADCLPLFLVDESRRVVAAVHCGWRGTLKRIAERAVWGLQVHYGCEPASLMAALGPCIGPACYEVGEDVRREFESAGLPLDDLRPHPQVRGKYFLDLVSANRRQLKNQGIKAKKIFAVGICTHCDKRLLSFRRDRDQTARLFNFIGIQATPRTRVRGRRLPGSNP